MVLEHARSQVGMLDNRLVIGFSDADLVEGLAAVQELKGRLSALEAQLLAEVDTRDLARKQLHWGSTTDWFTHLAGLTRRDGRRAVVHAQQLVAEQSRTLEALRRADVSAAQAGIICDAVDTLPSSPALRARGEQALLEEARRLNATELARTARHLADVIDPDRTERRDEAALAREERAAHAGRFLSVADDGAAGPDQGAREPGGRRRAPHRSAPPHQPVPAVDPDTPGCEVETIRATTARACSTLWSSRAHALDPTVPARTVGRHHGPPALVTGLGEDPSRATALDEVLDDRLRRAYSSTTGRGEHSWPATALHVPRCTRRRVMCHAHHIVLLGRRSQGCPGQSRPGLWRVPCASCTTPVAGSPRPWRLPPRIPAATTLDQPGGGTHLDPLPTPP